LETEFTAVFLDLNFASTVLDKAKVVGVTATTSIAIHNLQFLADTASVTALHAPLAFDPLFLPKVSFFPVELEIEASRSWRSRRWRTWRRRRRRRTSTAAIGVVATRAGAAFIASSYGLSSVALETMKTACTVRVGIAVSLAVSEGKGSAWTSIVAHVGKGRRRWGRRRWGRGCRRRTATVWIVAKVATTPVVAPPSHLGTDSPPLHYEDFR
jgi:hypothetical protein